MSRLPAEEDQEALPSLLPATVFDKLANYCSPLRRHSVSAPPSLALRTLETCQERVADLSAQVDRISRVCRVSQAGPSGSVPVVGRSKSLSVLPVIIVHPEATEMENIEVEVAKIKRPRRCHQCHTPVGEPVHSGVRPGVGVCTLPHWDACDGDIPEWDDAKGKIWAPCPSSEVSSSEESDPDNVEEVHETDGGPEVELSTTKQSGTESVDEKSSSSSDEEFDKQQLLVAKLQKQILEEKEKAAAAEDLAVQERKKQKRVRREERAAELAKQEKALREELRQAKSTSLNVKPKPASAKSKKF